MATLITKYLDEVNGKIKELEEYNVKLLGDATGLMFAYRGEPQDYGETKLTPSIYRDNKSVLKERYLFELLEDYNVIQSNRKIEKMIDAQHYVAISRGLDISFNVLVSLYFACKCEESSNEDGFIYIFCFPKYVSPHAGNIEDLYNIILDGDNNRILDKNFKVISHTKNNERIAAQSGGFIFFPGKKKYDISKIYYKAVRIFSEDKEQLLKELQLLFGINEAVLFPEKDIVAEHVKEVFLKGVGSENHIQTIENQISEYIKRLDYELEIEKLIHQDESDIVKYLQRRIRKEEDDIKNFLNRNNDIKDYGLLCKKVDAKFEELRRSKLC